MSKFKRTHYQMIAETLQRSKLNGNPSYEVQWDVIVEDLADMFKQDNTAFQKDRFERACVPGANVRARS